MLPLLALLPAQSGVLDLSAEEALKAPVTFKMRAMRMPLALAEISTKSNVKISSGPEFDNEPLIVIVNDVPLADLMAQTAKAAGGEWIKVNGEYRMLRPSSLTEKFKVQERVWVQRSMQAAQAGEGSPGRNAIFETAFREGVAEAAAAAGQTPTKPEKDPIAEAMRAAIYRIVTPATVSNLSPLDRVVFADRPSMWQIPAGGAGNELLRLAVNQWKSQKAAAEAAAKPDTGTATDPDEEIPDMEMPSFAGMFGRPQSAVAPNALRVIVKFDQPFEISIAPPGGGGFMGMFMGAMSRAFAEDGQPEKPDPNKRVYADFPEQSIALRAFDVTEHEIKLTNPERPITIKAPYDGFANLTKMFSTQSPSAITASPEFENMINRPDQFDPLGFFASDFLFALAEDQKTNIVAVPTDEMFEAGFSVMSGPPEAPTMPGYVKLLNESDQMTITKDGTFLRIEPTWKVRGLWVRANRVAMRKAIDQSREKLSMTLDERAEYAMANPDLTPAITMMYGMVTSMDMMNMFSMSQNFHDLRFYGSLGNVQRQALAMGQPLLYSALSPVQKAAAQRMVVQQPNFDFMGMMAFDDPDAVPKQPENEVPEDVEVTDLVTAPIERGMRFLATSEGETVVRIAENNGFPIRLPAMGAAMFGMMKESLQSPELAAFGEKVPDFNQLYLGQRQVISLRLFFSPTLARTTKFHDDRFSTQKLSYDALPKAFRDAAEKASGRMREGMRPDETP